MRRLEFGPIAQTVAIMLVLCLGASRPRGSVAELIEAVMGTIPLPREMAAFYTLFSRITAVAVMYVFSNRSLTAERW